MVEQPHDRKQATTSLAPEGALEESLYRGLLRVEDNLQALGYDLLPVGWRGFGEGSAVRDQEHDDLGHVQPVLARDAEPRGIQT